MKTYSRDEPDACREIDRWADGVGWLAHPDEPGTRASHAVRTPDGIWLLDPLRASGVDDLVDSLEGEVAGVAVCSAWHARDAGRVARRYDVPVSVPAWMGRVGSLIDASIERYEGDLAASVQVARYDPLPLWDEAICYFESHETLYVPESLGTAAPHLVGDERLGVHLACRLAPPRAIRAFEPDRVIVGHGEGVFDDATRALEDALAGARRRLPRALVENGPAAARSMVDAVRG